MKKSKFAVAIAAVLLAGMGLGRAQTEGPSVARVSFVQGSVQFFAGQGGDAQQAVINMPAMDGARLQTGNDGQAEVEFGDGSVARLTPNSALVFDHVGQDRVQLEQQGGLAYYEFNYGDGHPPFSVQFQNTYVQPTANTIVRVGLDAGWDVAVVSGSVSVQGPGIPPTAVAENQSLHPGDNGAPVALAQGIASDSWDNWNQDRDQAIAQEASEQTPVRDDSANPQNENWNDLDAYGNWYPVDGNNVWVPAGVDSGWDPYGAGYWGYYPTMGYTWISAYPWGWLPYHCGAWSYYSFGWGWAPGGCGRTWSPVIAVRSYPPGYRMPVRPVLGPGGFRPVGVGLALVDRGPAARGPWGFNHLAPPRPNHLEPVNFHGQMVAPVNRVDVRAQSFTSAPRGTGLQGTEPRGTGPGARAVLSGAPMGQRAGEGNTYVGGGNPSGQMHNQMQRPVQPQGQPQSQMARPVQPQGQMQPAQPQSQMRPAQPQSQMARPTVGYAGQPGFNQQQRSNYEQRPTPTPHYSPAPPQHMSAPPQMAPMHSAPAGGGGHR